MWAAELGLPYAFADFINARGAEIAASTGASSATACASTRRAPRSPSWAIAADTEEEAIRLAASSRMAFAMLRRGRLIEVRRRHRRCASSPRRATPTRGRRAILGTSDQVRAGLEEVAAAYGAEEVIVVTITHDHDARRHSYALLAEVGLSPASPIGARAHHGS